MLKNCRFAAVFLALPLLAACNSGAPAPKVAANPPAPPVDATPITGQWCSAAGQRFNISRDSFAENGSNCAIRQLNNYQGTFTASLTCEGQAASENITLSPVGSQLHITFLSRGGRRAIVSPC